MAEEEQERDNGNANREAQGKEQLDEAAADPHNEVAELKDRLLRMAAEFDNYKKRVAKDIDSSKAIGRADAITRLLPTLDEFELAMKAYADNEDDRMKGMALVYSNFVAALKGMGLREIAVDGKFDPYKHEIVLAQGSDMEEGSIIEVVRKGYMLNEIMLRPASVIVSKKEAGKENKEKEKKGE